MVRDRGSEWLRRHLDDPATRAAVDAITAEMQQMDRTEEEEELARWAEDDDREIHPGRGTSGPASQSAARALLRSAQNQHWVVTIRYPDDGVEVATMDCWENALADLDTSVARVPSDATIEVRLHVTCSSEDQAIAAAVARAAGVIALAPSATAADLGEPLVQPATLTGPAPRPTLQPRDNVDAGELLERLRDEDGPSTTGV